MLYKSYMEESMPIELPEVYSSILVIGLPVEYQAQANFAAFKQRGAKYAAESEIRLNRDIPEGTSVIVVYSPLNYVSADLPATRHLTPQQWLINELAGARRIPCFFTPMLSALEEFLNSRLTGNRIAITEKDEITHSQYVESVAPAGYDFNIRIVAPQVVRQALKDKIPGLNLNQVRAYLKRLREDRKKRAGVRTEGYVPEVIKEHKGDSPPKRITQYHLDRAPDVELPAHLCRKARRPAQRLDSFVSRFYRPNLPFSDLSLAKAVHKLAVTEGFEYVRATHVYELIAGMRRRSHSGKIGRHARRGSLTEKTPIQASA